MRKITVLSMITLDGVMQSPADLKKTRQAVSEYGGWVAPFDDEVYGEVMQKELEPADYLLGRKTYEIWAGYWPEHGAYWPGINEGAKYVYSNSLKMSDPMVAGWKNSVVINSVEDIRQLKRSQGADIQVWGSGELVQLLLENDLADELRIKIHPLTLGGGKKLFDKGTIPAAFSVAESIVTPSGVIIVHYKRAGQVKTGIVGG